MAGDKKKLLREVLILAAGAAIGVAVVLVATKKLARPVVYTPAQVSTNLPEVEVTVGERSVGKAVFANASFNRTEGWVLYATSPRRVVFVWDAPGNYPVFDVPPGWSVAWLDGEGTVQGTSDSPGVAQNMLLSGKLISRAAILPKTEMPQAGQRISFYSREAR